MLFSNHREINSKKSKVLQAFTGINSVHSFAKLQLPIASYQQDEHTHRGHIDIEKAINLGQIKPTSSILFEIDLQRIKTLKERLCLHNLDCYPLIWCYQEVQSQTYTH